MVCIMKKYFLTAVFLFTTLSLMSQVVIRGTVTEASTGKPVSLAAVMAGESKGTVTGRDGSYNLSVSQDGRIKIAVTCLGYRSQTREVIVSGREEFIVSFELEHEYIDNEEVVVTASRSETSIRSVPARVNIISRPVIMSVPALTADELLYMTPGVNISRSFGIFSHKSSVTMRGLSGNEQGRVLVMINGVPVNKSDGGSVNWNLLNPDMIERIEVVKGPGSSLYGGNAMGGAINIITMKPVERFAGGLTLGYSTYNTPSASLSLSGREGGADGRFFWSLNGFYRSSDGYITQSEADRIANPYITKSAMEEMNVGLRTGFDINSRNTVELDLLYYDDFRGSGEVVYQPLGNTTDHDTWQARLNYNGANRNLSWKVSLFASEETYRRVNEFMRDDYTWYEVLSRRGDKGILSSGTWQSSPLNRLTFGFDLRSGSVDADDIYYTSTDVVTNRGSIGVTGLFLQDELSLAGSRLRIVSALRFDHASFYDGAFVIQAPSGETAFMTDMVNSDLEDVSWNALSPKISVLYMTGERSRVYASWSRGFRPPVLDELSRSGRVRGGFKLANPALGPETLDNFEVGSDFFITDKMNGAISVYQSFGTDFLYYVNSGDSIDMGFGLRPILSRQNISGVSITGAEVELNYLFSERFTISGNMVWNRSVVSRFEAGEDSPANISGNYLTDVPAYSGSVRATWLESFGSASIIARYTGAMWANDLNQFDEIIGADKYPEHLSVDLRIKGQYKYLTAGVSVQNVFNSLFYDSKGAVCPGRFITLETSVKF
jgi:iron complex outermembrane receptor protein